MEEICNFGPGYKKKSVLGQKKSDFVPAQISKVWKIYCKIVQNKMTEKMWFSFGDCVRQYLTSSLG